MKEKQNFEISISGHVKNGEDIAIIESVRNYMSSSGHPIDSLNARFDVLLFLGTEEIFIALSFSNVPRKSSKLYLEDYRHLGKLDLKIVKSISREKYSFKAPYIFSFPTNILNYRDDELSVFKQCNRPVDISKCFVMMPFAKELDSVFNVISDIIKTLPDHRMVCVRADTSTKPDLITQFIWEEINSARLLIADLTWSNPNVYYEVGLAHSLGKPVIFVTQDRKIPFDLNNIRCIQYSLKEEKSLKKFRKSLKMAIIDVLMLLDRKTEKK